jgi:hypothetical protein
VCGAQATGVISSSSLTLDTVSLSAMCNEGSCECASVQLLGKQVRTMSSTRTHRHEPLPLGMPFEVTRNVFKEDDLMDTRNISRLRVHESRQTARLQVQSARVR